jgi:hypothetical protein
MPNEVFVFAAIATGFIVLATLVTIVLWRWRSSPLPASLRPPRLSIRVQRLFHASAGAELDSRALRGKD